MELSLSPATAFMDDDFEAQTESAAADSSTSLANPQISVQIQLRDMYIFAVFCSGQVIRLPVRYCND